MTTATRLGPLPRSVLARAAAVLLLVAGVLAMHALSASHGASPASRSPVAATSSISHAAPVSGTERSHACVDCEGHQAPANSGSHLLDVCLAVLLAAAALVLLLLGARARRASHLVARRPTDVRAALRPLVDALRPPSLSILCVLRT